MKVSIVGATGYGGLELIRLLKMHPKFTITSLHTSSKFGEPIHNEYAHLLHEEYLLNKIDPEKIAKQADVVFLATPSGASSELVASFKNLDIKVIDLSGDLRLKTPGEYEKWYKRTPAPADLLSKAVYGLSEWNADQIKDAEILSNPGCYPTATLLGLAPLYKEGLASGEDVIVDAKSAVSGAGKSPTDATHFSTMNENFKVYKVHNHQHIPEIEQQLGIWSEKSKPISFTTHLVPMTRGIMVTMYVKLLQKMTTEQLHKLYIETYQNHPFVRIQPIGSFPATKQVYGSNFCDIGVAYDERTQKVTIISVIDNLVKGAAGQAIQNANLMMGYEETSGLMTLPLYP